MKNEWYFVALIDILAVLASVTAILLFAPQERLPIDIERLPLHLQIYSTIMGAIIAFGFL